MRKYLDTARENANKNKAENEVFKKVIDAAEVEIPQSMIDREADSLLADYKNRLAAQGNQLGKWLLKPAMKKN